jgi:hypothetical protein
MVSRIFLMRVRIKKYIYIKVVFFFSPCEGVRRVLGMIDVSRVEEKDRTENSVLDM